MLANRIAFVEGGRDDVLFLEQYVLLGNYQHDEDRFETFDALAARFPARNGAGGRQRAEEMRKAAQGPSGAGGFGGGRRAKSWRASKSSATPSRASSSAAAACSRAWGSAPTRRSCARRSPKSKPA